MSVLADKHVSSCLTSFLFLEKEMYVYYEGSERYQMNRKLLRVSLRLILDLFDIIENLHKSS